MMPSSAAMSGDEDDNTAAVSAGSETEMTNMQPQEQAATPIESPEVGESLPSPEEVRATVNPRPAGGRGGSGMLVAFGAAVIVLIALTVGLGVGISNRNDKSNPGGRQSTVDSVERFVVDEGLSDPAAFDDELSPQIRAARWMALVDPLNLPTPSSSFDIDVDLANHFVIRYALTVLYFSTGGEDWRFQFNFVTENPACEWNGSLLSSSGGFLPFGLQCNQQGQPFALYLDNNRLTGSLPHELSALKTLKIIDFNYNDDLGGFFPQGLCDIKELDSLSMAFTDVTGQLPDCINQLTLLRQLFLSNTQMSGPLPTMNGMTSLQRLFLDDNGFEGDITTAFDYMPELRFLFLEDNDFMATVDDSFLKSNDKLVQLDLSDNELQGTLPLHLFQFPDLQLIDLHGNFLQNVLPDWSVVTQTSLLFLALHENDIQGDLPASIANLKSLYHLDLSMNHLEGALTPELGSLTNLTYLFLGDNNFSPGPVPDTFASLTRMEEFSVKNTNRAGLLPPFISTWTNLILLDLDGNDFDGIIPESYGQLVNMQFLLLNDNLLAGDVPQSFDQMVNLRAAFFETNLFTGDLEHLCSLAAFNENTGDLDGDELLVADCAGGLISCTCCVCCDPNSILGEAEECNDHELIASLDPIWENTYRRVEFKFGNDTRFIDRDFLP